MAPADRAGDATSPGSDPVVEAIFDAIASTAPTIRAELPHRRVESGAAENPSGETVMAGDLYADELLAEALSAVNGVGSYVSEERQEALDAGEDVSGDAYAVAVDPLDGSSNLRSNNAMGTVVGIYDAPLPASGEHLVAAGYVLFGPITTAVIADATGVREEVVEPDPDAEHGVSRSVVVPDLELPAEPTVYGFGGRVPDWPDAFRSYAREIEDELKLRYGGSMVGDVNQVLTYGGIFAYPALRDEPDGKLRLLFEANPIAYVIEQAGGAASDGSSRILEIDAEGLHDRVPLYVGNEELVARLEAALADG